MEMLALVGTGQFGTVSDAARVEVGLAVVVAVLVALLVAVRSNRAAAAHRRQAAGTVYFDHDAAHFGPGGRRTATIGVDPAAGRGPARRPRPGAGRAMAPSFAAPVPTRRHRVARPGPVGPPARAAAAPVRSDASSAIRPPSVVPPATAVRPERPWPVDLPAMTVPPRRTPPPESTG